MQPEEDIFSVDFSLFLLGCVLQPNILSELSLIYFSWLYEKSSYEDIWELSLLILYTIMRKIVVENVTNIYHLFCAKLLFAQHFLYFVIFLTTMTLMYLIFHLWYKPKTFYVFRDVTLLSHIWLHEMPRNLGVG